MIAGGEGQMSATVSIRAATPDDAAAVTAVLRASYPRLMAAAYDAGLLARTLPAITKANPRLLASGTYHLAEAGGGPVGCGGWSFERPGAAEVEPGVGHLRHFATRAGWTGRGIGGLIYEHCEAQARAAGVTVLECYASLNAEPFYASLGFRTIGRIEVKMSNGVAFPSIHMRHSIRQDDRGDRDPA
jgi:GNAT superfamily N-acetyltransferase